MIVNIVVQICMSCNSSLLKSSSSMTYFNLLKSFKVDIHLSSAPMVKKVIWKPPNADWLKCNYDGSFDTQDSGNGGIFRDYKGNFILGFVEQTYGPNSLHPEFSAVLRAIKIVREKT